MDQPIDWLLTSSPWVDYHTRIDLIGQSEKDQSVIAARTAMIYHPTIVQLIAELTNWPGSILVSHKSAGHSLHKLVFLADLGLSSGDPGMKELISHVMEHQDADGPFQMLTNIPAHFGGSGEDTWAWSLCDAPSVLYALIKFGVCDDPRVKKGVEMVAHLVGENGWPCAASKQLGSFHGPGRKSDPCPYANLIMVKLLSQVEKYRESEACRSGVESILNCWSERLTYHPYIFYMGNDFCKLKAPLVWFDILHVAFVLSQFSWVKNDPRYLEMVSIIANKADPEGRFTPESVWMAWKEWDFGQKKAPSAWLTYIALKILKT